MEFACLGTQDVYDGIASKRAAKVLPSNLAEKARIKLVTIAAATEIDQLRYPPGNRLETLSGDRRGQFSIRINQKYRICFMWTELGASNVEIVNYH